MSDHVETTLFVAAMTRSNADRPSDNKEVSDVDLAALDSEIRQLEFGDSSEKRGATIHDVRDMDALGLAPTFHRRFKFVAMVGFSSTVVVSWQNVRNASAISII